jgi:hypothetical protein
VRPPPERSLGIEALFGYAGRLDGASDDARYSSRNGVGYQFGAHWGPSRLLSLGLVYSRSQAGSESKFSTSEQDVARVVNAALVELRFYPLRGAPGRVFVGAQAGLGWESADFTTSGLPLAYRDIVPINRTCSARGNLGPAGGLNVGADLELGHNVSFLMKASASLYLLRTNDFGSQEDGCGQGGGHMATFDGRIGLQYRFDLGR